MTMSFELLTGRSEEHLECCPELNASIHGEILLDLLKLREDAMRAGFEISLASSFRSFERQLAIFNAKARGERAILDLRGVPLDPNNLTDHEKLFAILRWSALPGSSRHHWGTDLDIFDKKAISPDYKLQLVPGEFEKGGPFAPFHDWLDEKMSRTDFPFFRPYAKDQGGVSPERWHLSHRYALEFSKSYSLGTFKRNIELADIEMKELILERAEEIFTNFVTNVSQPPWP